MRRTSDLVLVILLVIAFYIALPASLLWGWVRWGKSDQKRNVFSILSFIGFSLASFSAILAISTMMYARLIRGFPYYDPMLLRIYGAGGLLSIGGFLFGVSGAWRPNSLRWHAPLCAMGMLLLWWAMALTE